MWFDLLVQWHEESLQRSQYQVLMLPKPQIRQRKVLYYDFRKPVPEVAEGGADTEKWVAAPITLVIEKFTAVRLPDDAVT